VTLTSLEKRMLIYGITISTCKLRLFQRNSFINIIYFYKKIKGKCCCITNKKKPQKTTSYGYDKIKVANGIQQRSYISFFWSGVCVFFKIGKKKIFGVKS
jgi:hypothetical protein